MSMRTDEQRNPSGQAWEVVNLRPQRGPKPRASAIAEPEDPALIPKLHRGAAAPQRSERWTLPWRTRERRQGRHREIALAPWD